MRPSSSVPRGAKRRVAACSSTLFFTRILVRANLCASRPFRSCHRQRKPGIRCGTIIKMPYLLVGASGIGFLELLKPSSLLIPSIGFFLRISDAGLVQLSAPFNPINESSAGRTWFMFQETHPSSSSCRMTAVRTASCESDTRTGMSWFG